MAISSQTTCSTSVTAPPLEAKPARLVHKGALAPGQSSLPAQAVFAHIQVSKENPHTNYKTCVISQKCVQQ